MFALSRPQPLLNKINGTAIKPLLVTLPLLASSQSFAAQPSTISPSTQTINAQISHPLTTELTDKFDWLQLKSNEILKGEIKHLYDDKLEFESDNLDTVIIDWDDIKVLKSKGIVSIGLTDLTTRTGKLYIQDGQGYIDGIAFNTKEIMTIIEGQPKESNYWSGKISLGANLRKGNTDQIDYSANAKTTRRTTESRFNADYLGNYTKTEGENTVNNHRVNSNFDWFLSKQFYLRPVFGEYYKDPFLNLDYKLTLGSGIGYNIIDNAKTEWSISGGPAYTYTQFSEVEAGGDDSEGSASLVIDTVYDTELTSYIDFTAQYRLQYGSQDSGGYSHHAIATFAIELTDLFDLDLSMVWDRTNNPRANSDGTVPDANDYQFIVGVGIDF